jgi:hypothetical protein
LFLKFDLSQQLSQAALRPQPKLIQQEGQDVGACGMYWQRIAQHLVARR